MDILPVINVVPPVLEMNLALAGALEALAGLALFSILAKSAGFVMGGARSPITNTDRLAPAGAR